MSEEIKQKAREEYREMLDTYYSDYLEGLWCCNRRDCGCDGITVKEQLERATVSFFEDLLSQALKKRDEIVKTETINLIKEMWDMPDVYTLTKHQTRETHASYLDPDFHKYDKGYQEAREDFLKLLSTLNKSTE